MPELMVFNVSKSALSGKTLQILGIDIEVYYIGILRRQVLISHVTRNVVRMRSFYFITFIGLV